MSNKRAVAVIAAIAFVIGAVLLFLPLSAGRVGNKIECGSAISPRYAQADIADIMNPGRTSRVEDCEDTVSGRRSVGFPLAGVGAAGLLFVYLTSQRRTSAVEPVAETTKTPDPPA